MADVVSGLVVDHLHRPGGWHSPGYLTVDDAGRIVTAAEAPPPGFDPASALRLTGFAVPGMPNLHSHAFQRALVGRAEAATGGRADSFWSWREAMYALAEAIGPDDLEALATGLYVEMLEAGYTAVGEFHYLHHGKDGTPYAQPAELSLRIFEAARRAGIGLTHLPVLYQAGGFGRSAEDRQRRFVHADVDGYLALVAALRDAARAAAGDGWHGRVGIAPHSLRAVAPDRLEAAVAGARALDPEMPIHIHVAEQVAEVEDCLAHLGRRPVAFLLDALPVDEGWCLVHATHLDEAELAGLAGSGAVAGLCPTTEANLGDGIFPAEAYLARGGAFGVGSDSQASVSVADELRLLEYGQRLGLRRRNVLGGDLAAGASRSVGRHLYDEAAAGGARALGLNAGELVPGRRADLVVLDPDHPRLAGHGPGTVLDAWILGGAEGAVRDVLVGGRRLVSGGRHVDRDAAFDGLRRTLAGLFGRAGGPGADA